LLEARIEIELAIHRLAEGLVVGIALVHAPAFRKESSFPPEHAF
jgi:hypothetical protein